MKIKDGIVIRQIDDEYVLVDTGKIKPRFNGMIKLNETSKDIIELLQKNDLDKEKLLKELLNIYDASSEEMSDAIEEVLSKLEETKILIK